ncbi:MAG: antibiotic biosynthesis monooxygenase family protein [Rhodothermales bacterium]|nr:antibiotic biosynthesis monooxygenase family protein [Rhodothermales bacterium]
MAYVVVATWRAKPGKESFIEGIVRTMAALSSQEPGAIHFIAQRSADDPATFLLYEQYVDEACFEAHKQTVHFKEYVLGQALPHLEHRERAIYTTLD